MTHTEKKFCPYCGKQSPITYRYCAECGYEIPDVSAIPQKSNIQSGYYSEQNQPTQTIIYAPTVTRKRGYGRLIFFIAVATLFIYTNPSEKMHLDFIKEIGHKELNKTRSSYSNIVRLFEVILGDERFNGLLKDFVKRKDYVFFSLTEIQFKGKTETVAIGVLGNIILWEELKNSFDRILIKYDL